MILNETLRQKTFFRRSRIDIHSLLELYQVPTYIGNLYLRFLLYKPSYLHQTEHVSRIAVTNIITAQYTTTYRSNAKLHDYNYRRNNLFRITSHKLNTTLILNHWYIATCISTVVFNSSKIFSLQPCHPCWSKSLWPT